MDCSRTRGSTRRIRIENRTPQAGKTRLRLIVGGTRRAATGTPACTHRTPGAPPGTACVPCRWPTPHFSCDHDGLLRRFSTRTRRVAEKVRELIRLGTFFVRSSWLRDFVVAFLVGAFRWLGNRHLLAEIHVLDGIQQAYAFGHRPLKRFAARDQTHPAGAFVDHRGLYRFLQIAFTC